MKKFTLFFACMLSLLSMKATHNRSGEIIYTRIAPFTNVVSGVTIPIYTYSITLITYTDDGAGIADRCADTLYFGDGSKSLAHRINGLSGASCQCTGADACGEIILNQANYRVKKNVYSVIHTYSGTGSYHISFSDPSRNANIINIPNSINQPFFIESLLIITASTGQESSPALTNPPVDQGFVSSCYFHNPVAVDADGDSLSYELIACKGANGQDIPGFVFPDAGAGGTFMINNTGLLNWCTPKAVGEYNIAVKITDWRRNFCHDAYQMMGYITRDMQMVIKGGTAPVFTVSPLSDCVSAGSTLSITFSTPSPTLSSSAELYGSCTMNNPPASLTLNTAQNNGTFSWPSINGRFAQSPPHYLDVIYTANSNASFRIYQPIVVKVVPPPVQIYSIHHDTGTVNIRWHSPMTGSGNISEYRVYRKAGANSWAHGFCQTGAPASSGFSLVLIAQPTDTSFTDIYMQPFSNGSNLNYMVTAVTKDCQEGFAENAQSVEVLVGIKQIPEELASITVYPNPFNDAFEINPGTKLISELQTTLFSSDGRLLTDRTDKAVENKIRIPGADLKPGLYILRLKTANGTVYKKLVKE